MTTFRPIDCDLPAVAWDVLQKTEIPMVLSVDTDAAEILVASLDEEGRTRVYLDQLVKERIKFQAIYPWPPTGKPKLFNCYYREVA